MKEDAQWIVGIIQSCINPFQLDCCHNLLHNFRQIHGKDDETGEHSDNIYSALEDKTVQLSV